MSDQMAHEHGHSFMGPKISQVISIHVRALLHIVRKVSPSLVDQTFKWDKTGEDELCQNFIKRVKSLMQVKDYVSSSC